MSKTTTTKSIQEKWKLPVLRVMFSESIPIRSRNYRLDYLASCFKGSSKTAQELLSNKVG